MDFADKYILDSFNKYKDEKNKPYWFEEAQQYLQEAGIIGLIHCS